MHLFVIIILFPLASVIEVRGESSVCWRPLLQRLPCLFEVNLGVAGWHMYCVEVIEVVEHRILVEVTVGALALKPTY
jgi:hypothetical protein